MIKLPRLYVNGKFEKILHPISASITQNVIPLDSASLTLPSGEELPPRSYVELFTPYGSAGMFRVRNPRDAYGQDTTTADLEHLVAEIGDYVVKEEISEMMDANKALLRVFRYYEGGLWQLGSLSGLGTKSIACEAKYDRVLDSILAIMEQIPDCMMKFDFSTTPWTLNFYKKGSSVTAEGRLARNVKSATITYDDTELCTRLWYQTYDKDKNAKWNRKDADTLKKYGIVEGKINTSSDMTSDEITSMVDTYIAEHKNPRVSISIQADYLSEITGESMDRFVVGELFRLNLVDYGMVVEKNVTTLSWADVYGQPRNVTVTLGDEEDTVVTFLHNLDATGSGGGGGGKAKDDAEEEQNNIQVQWEKTDTAVVGLVSASDKYGNILEQAGLTLDKDGMIVYVKDKPNGLYHQFEVLEDTFTSTIKDTKKDLQSEIKQERDRISLVVKGTGKNAKINAASICIGINEDTSSYAKINADKIYLLGDTIANKITADYINTKIASLSTLSVSALSATGSIHGGSVEASNIYVLGSDGQGHQTNTNLKTAVIGVEVDGNTLTLTQADGTETNFSKATPVLSGSWSGGTFTANATGASSSLKTALFDLTNSDITWSGNTATCKVYANLDEGETKLDTGKRLSVNAKVRYDAGFDADHQLFCTVDSGTTKQTTLTLNPGNSANVYPAFKKTNDANQYGAILAVTAALPKKSAISLTRTKKTTEPTTDGTLSRITSNAWYLLEVTVSGVTKTWKVQVDV